MTDEIDILNYKDSVYEPANRLWFQLTKVEKIEELEKRIATCLYYTEAWNDAYNLLKEEWEELTEARK